MNEKRKPLVIGGLTFERPFFLAPLAGISDKSMRSLCAAHGASLTFTEMVSAKGLYYGDRKSRKLLEIGDSEPAVGYQLFGREPEILAYAVRELSAEDNLLFDLNCGCPVPKVVKNGEGSALLKELDVLYDVVKAMAGATSKPVTVKIRMGFAKGENTAVETAKAAEAAGAAAVTVHGRTREQYYEGKANWSAIVEVKKAVSIPVIGNGDVMTGEDAIRMMDETGCDGVMIARGALGNPWIFEECKVLWEGERTEITDDLRPSREERIETLLTHFDMVCADKGERVAVREMRKFIGWYVKGMHGAAALRRVTNSIEGAEELKKTLRTFDISGM